MTDIVVDSSVVAKWVLPEADSPSAEKLLVEAASIGTSLFVLDLAFAEVTNAIWKRQRRQLITQQSARSCCEALRSLPVQVVSAERVLPAALEIAMRYDRAVYDALFIALAEELKLTGVTADEPLCNALRADFPRIVLLRNL